MKRTGSPQLQPLVSMDSGGAKGRDRERCGERCTYADWQPPRPFGTKLQVPSRIPFCIQMIHCRSPLPPLAGSASADTARRPVRPRLQPQVFVHCRICAVARMKRLDRCGYVDSNGRTALQRPSRDASAGKQLSLSCSESARSRRLRADLLEKTSVAVEKLSYREWTVSS